MRYRNQKRICLILALFMCFSGLFSKMVKADVLFVSSQPEENDFCISLGEQSLWEDDVCPAGLPAVKTTSNVRYIAGRVVYGRNDVKVSPYSLCPDMASRFFSNLFMAVHVVQFQEMYSRLTILNYIHNIDGKKRFLFSDMQA